MKGVLEHNLQVRVKEALMTATNICSTMKSRISDEMIEDVIREAIRPIRFNDKQGVLFYPEAGWGCYSLPGRDKS